MRYVNQRLRLAETKDHWNWETLDSIVGRVEERELRDAARAAVKEVFKQEREHLQWNQDTLSKLAMEMAEQQQGAEREESESEGESSYED